MHHACDSRDLAAKNKLYVHHACGLASVCSIVLITYLCLYEPFEGWNDVKSFSCSQASPTCPSDKISIKMKISINIEGMILTGKRPK